MAGSEEKLDGRFGGKGVFGQGAEVAGSAFRGVQSIRRISSPTNAATVEPRTAVLAPLTHRDGTPKDRAGPAQAPGVDVKPMGKVWGRQPTFQTKVHLTRCNVRREGIEPPTR